MSEENAGYSGGSTESAQAGEVTVEGPGVSITRRVDEATLASVIGLLFGAAPGPIRGGGGRTSGGETGGGGRESTSQWDEDITLGEFISDTGAATFQHKICATGYFLMHIKGHPSFSREEVRTALSNAHEDMPGNYTRDFNNAASSRLIAARDGEAGQYIVPRTGKVALESNFQDLPRRRAGRKTAKKAAPKAEDQ